MKTKLRVVATGYDHGKPWIGVEFDEGDVKIGQVLTTENLRYSVVIAAVLGGRFNSILGKYRAKMLIEAIEFPANELVGQFLIGECEPIELSDEARQELRRMLDAAKRKPGEEM